MRVPLVFLLISQQSKQLTSVSYEIYYMSCLLRVLNTKQSILEKNGKDMQLE